MEIPGSTSAQVQAGSQPAALLREEPAPAASGNASGTSETSRKGFAQALEAARRQTSAQPPRPWTVQRGENLTRIAQRTLEQASPGKVFSPGQLHQMAMRLAQHNELANADLLMPGQSLDVSPALQGEVLRTARPAVAAPGGRLAQAVARVELPKALPALPQPPVDAVSTPSIVRIDQAPTQGNSHPLLAQTVQRAAGLGFIPNGQTAAVQSRILDLAGKHGFMPDDFARAVLMESDGMNPRANNGRCFGIIQFCDGPDRGAASAGYGQRASDILKLSVLDQLDLVDRYFDDTKLKDYRGSNRAVSLEDLYLTILTPAARSERRPHAALPISGPQAPALHVARNTRAPITRQSLFDGIITNARERLGSWLEPLRSAQSPVDKTRVASAAGNSWR